MITTTRKSIKNRLRNAEARAAQDLFQINRALLTSLIRDVRADLKNSPCDGSPRYIAAWCTKVGRDFLQISDALGQYGALCDCEVIANIHPETIFAVYDEST